MTYDDRVYFTQFSKSRNSPKRTHVFYTVFKIPKLAEAYSR